MANTTWRWPLRGYNESNITSGVGPRWGSTHSGLDIGVPKGTPVLATRAGKVVKVSNTCTHNFGKQVGQDSCGGGYGNYIYIDHGDGYVSRYAHLTDIDVKEGDTVSIGQVIGTVGSTGNSTGNHLHFEIRLNGNYVDPEKYVSSSSDTTVASGYNPNNTNTTDDNNSSYTTLDTVEAGGVTVGQRVSGLTPQPLHAFVNIYVGDKKLLLATNPARPNIIQSFEITRLDDKAAGTVIFTVFDDNWDEIEEVLSANFDKVWVEYGYYGTGVRSDLYKLMLSSYNISFESTGTILSVEAMTEDATDNITPRSLALNTFNPTEAVKKICKELGYIVLDENFDSSQDIHADNPFNMIEDFPISYIQYHIIPQASEENEEVFQFYIDSEKKAHFKRKSYKSVTSTDTLRTYIYQKGYDSTVIDFEVNINGKFGGMGPTRLATGYRSCFIDTKNKSQISENKDISSSITEAPGTVSHTSHDQSEPIVDAAGYSAAQMKNRLYYDTKCDYDAYEATLTIVGDPTIKWSDQYVRIINVKDNGYLHHTSGVYQILSITDSISGGEMITTLKLTRVATVGDIDGVEILNPKYLIK